MSFWAATVITNFLTVLPIVGDDIVYRIWGGYASNNATLNRFFSPHYLLPFGIAALVSIHLYMLHQSSSATELRIKMDLTMRVSFYPYFAIKDLLTSLLRIITFLYIVFYIPEAFNHSVNYIPANLLVTPSHIVPEWYFLPYYAILRPILNKTVGICAFASSVSIYYFFPLVLNSDLLYIYNGTARRCVWLFISNFIFLGYLGSQTAEYPCVEFGMVGTLIHFLFLLELIAIGRISNSMYHRLATASSSLYISVIQRTS